MSSPPSHLGTALLAVRRTAELCDRLDAGKEPELASVVAAVETFRTTHGYCPSLTDLAGALGWSRENTRNAVASLVAAGALSSVRGVSRSLRVASAEERAARRVAVWRAALGALSAPELRAAQTAIVSLSTLHEVGT